MSKSSKRSIVWETPPLDYLKFNVDGSVRGKPELFSIMMVVVVGALVPTSFWLMVLDTLGCFNGI